VFLSISRGTSLIAGKNSPARSHIHLIMDLSTSLENPLNSRLLPVTHKCDVEAFVKKIA
jgi:hypothetical protein